VRSRSFVVVVLAIVGLFVLAGAMFAYDSSRRNTIANGIKVGGIDIGGLTTAQARARLRTAYAGRLQRPLVARFHGRGFVLTQRASRVSVDIDGSVADALAQTRSANIFSRTWRSLTGGRLNAALDPKVTFSQAAVVSLVRQVGDSLNRPARDASISYSGASIGTVQSHTGLAVDTSALTSALDNALRHPATARAVSIRARSTKPRVSDRQLGAEFPTIITVDRSGYTLRLWKHLRLAKSYPIAVGQQGLETPAGLYHAQDKQVDPSWHVPNSSWAGALAGQTIPPGPQDPLKARWIGIYNGAGIHGTEATGSLGSAASHGCIRMAIPDVIELYDQTPLGTPIYIA
jgi:lipoprotein-anchoring transpeptidase ErfK/SrfK